MFVNESIQVFLKVRISILLQLLQHPQLVNHLLTLRLQRPLNLSRILAMLLTHFFFLLWINLFFFE